MERKGHILNPDIFVEAAEILTEGFVVNCCPAIAWAAYAADDREHGSELNRIHQNLFAALFAEDRRPGAPWWDYGEIEPRLLALLLAAEIYEIPIR
jgi:hypothetical protein